MEADIPHSPHAGRATDPALFISDLTFHEVRRLSAVYDLRCEEGVLDARS